MTERTVRYIEATIVGVTADVQAAISPCRHAALNKAAFKLGLIGMDVTRVTGILTPPALAIGLKPRDIARTIKAGWNAGWKHL